VDTDSSGYRGPVEASNPPGSAMRGRDVAWRSATKPKKFRFLWAKRPLSMSINYWQIGADMAEQLQFPELLTIEEVAALLGVNLRYVRRMVAERRIPIVKIGHLVRIEKDDIESYVRAQRRPSRDELDGERWKRGASR
jgi:excisionase family DNA binding protein